MSALGKKLRRADGGRIMFWCPGCKAAHAVIVDGSRGWTFDGNVAAPTFAPSVLVRTGRAVDPDFEPQPDDPPEVCHSFVRSGQVQFLNDCTHDLAGQTVPLPDFPGAS